MTAARPKRRRASQTRNVGNDGSEDGEVDRDDIAESDESEDGDDYVEEDDDSSCSEFEVETTKAKPVAKPKERGRKATAAKPREAAKRSRRLPSATKGKVESAHADAKQCNSQPKASAATRKTLGARPLSAIAQNSSTQHVAKRVKTDQYSNCQSERPKGPSYRAGLSKNDRIPRLHKYLK